MIPGFAAGFAVKPVTSSSSWSNVYSMRYAGTVTGDAGRTNFGQPANWSKNLTHTTTGELTVTMRFKRNGRDGVLMASRNVTNGYMYIATASPAIAATFGGNFASGGTIADATWTALTWTVKNEAGTNVGRCYLASSSTSVLNTVAGSNPVIVDFILNERRDTNNTDFVIGAWGTSNIDELAVWSVGFSGADHTEYNNGGVPFNLLNHSKSASIISYYRCGDAAGDSSTVLKDTVGTYDGTHTNTSNVSYTTEVA